MANARFPIITARQELGVTPTTAVRFTGDVRTGEGAVGAAIGQAILGLGSRWYIMEADTQLSEARMLSQKEHTRLMLELPGIEPPEHAKAYEKSLETQQGFIPKNNMAAAAYGRFLNNFTPQRELDVTNATKAKLKDNMRATGFVMQQEAIQTGNLTEYLTHLAKGKMLGIYDAEEVVKYRQATIDGRERYVKLQTAEQLEQLEVQREINRDEISKLIRAGQSADAAIEESSLDEKEQFTWFERQRLETERRLKGEEIPINSLIKGELEAMAYDISTGAVTMAEFNKRLVEERYDKKTIDDGVYDELFSLAQRKFDSYQAEAMKGREVYALGQLVTFPSELGFAERLAQLTSQFEKEQAQTLRQLQFDNLDRYKKALRDWLKKNKDANADEIYKEGRKLLTQYRKTPDQLRNPLTAGEAAVKAIKEIAAQEEIRRVGETFKNLPQPKTKAEYDKLKAGTKYLDPEGVERIKK